jgi:RHS repeat-associated protein
LQPAGTPCGPAEACAADGQCVATNDAPVVNAGPDQNIDFQNPKPSPNFTLQRISTLFNNPVGIEYHPLLKRMVMSVNCCNGQPYNFESVRPDGTHEPYTNFNGLGDEVYFAIARDEVNGFNIGGFPAGQMFTGNGQAGHITRISPDGSTIENPWIILPGEPGLMRGQLQFDRTGVYNGDLIVSTTAGHIWRVTPAGDATMVADLHLGGDFEGLTTVPNDPLRYGPWAGKILTGDENRDGIYAVDDTGEVTLYPLLMRPENIHLVPPGENFFGVDYFGGTLYGASASQFKSMVGDIIVTEEFTGDVWHVRWNGTDFDSTLLARVVLWEHTAFGPAAMAEIVSSEVDVALSGTATDDGRPTGSTLSTTWSVVSGPAPVRFADSHAASTTATFIDAGTYVLALTATDGTLTTTDTMTVVIRRISPNNKPPVADAGPDQTIQIPEVTALVGAATDDGLPLGSAISLTWTQLSGPVPATIVNPTAGFTSVLFAVAGAYVFQLEASDSEMTSSDTVTITVNPEPPLAGSTLSIALSDPGPMPLGAGEYATVVLLDASATPIPHFPIRLTSTGANPFTNTIVSDDFGVAVFGFTGTYPGTDQLHATATGFSSSQDSATVSVTWLDIPLGAPLLTQGWIKSPLHQSTLTDRTPITLSDNITLRSGTLSYWPWSHPEQVHTLATGLSKLPGDVLGMFDTTTLANGTYIIDLSGTDDAGNQRESEVLVIVNGEYKPGRVVVELTDFEVPIANLPITIGRRYDSLEKDNVGDFGNGWSLMIGHPKLEVDGAKNVTITMPNGQRSTFYFGPTNPVLNGGTIIIVVGFLFFPAYLAASGLHGKLTANGCPVLTRSPFSNGLPVCFGVLHPSELEYAPTEYTYTDPYGTAYVMGATGELRAIKDRLGNSLTFTPNGILSSTGQNVTFVRDPQGRITSVDYPAYFHGEDNAARYQYDAAGDLTIVDLAKNPFVFFRTMHHSYDGAHRLLTSIDPNGNPVRTSTYGADGRLATDSDALGNIFSYTYDLATRTNTTTLPDTGAVSQTFDARGLVLSETDQLGHTTTHAYDADRNEISRTNPLGEVTTMTYDESGNVTSEADPTGTKHTTYNPFSLPTAITDRSGHVTSIDYDDQALAPTRFADKLGTRLKFTNSDQGQPLTVEDAEGHLAHLDYDVAGNVITRKDWLGRTTHATYDEAGHKLSETSARGGLTTNVYSLDGNLTGTTDANGYSRQRRYDPHGNLTVEYDVPSIRGQTNYTYDALNHLTQVWHVNDGPGGTTVNYTRDFRGKPLTMTDENGHTTTYTYDLAANLIKMTFADGTFTTRTYDALNRLATLTDERGNTTSYEYQPGGSNRVTRVTDPLGHATVTAFDGDGRQVSVTDANGKTTSFVYDDGGQLIETHYPDGTVTYQTYNARGLRASITHQTGATIRYGYDAQGQVTSVTDPLSKVTQYGYDLDGNLTSVTDANGHATSYAYDALRRRTKRTLPLGQFETFAYDLAERQASHTDFRGKTTTMTYDTRGRMLTKVPDASLGEPSQTYTYSPTGMRTSMIDGSGTTSYTYDPRDRMLTKAAVAGTITYAYDASGNVASVDSSNANGTSVSYTWDATNQLASITDNRVGGTTTTAYTPTRRPSRLSQPNGIGSTYSYDSLDRVTSLLWRQGTSPDPIARWVDLFDARGQRTSSTDVTGRSASYGYDAASHLTSETISGDPRGAGFNGGLEYSLDGTGNRLTRTSTLASLGAQSFSYDANDQLSTETYDANGNTLSTGGHTFAYDFENRLVSKDGAAATVAYDCDGNRVAKTVGGVTTRYLVDDLSPTGYTQVLEEVVGGAVQTRYTYGRNVVSQTRNVSSTAATSYYGYDAHGNVTFLTDGTGAVTDSYDYDAWGTLVASTGATPNTRRYVGEEFDPDLGLINLRARSFNTATGRFLTLDPMEPSGTASKDPLGSSTWNKYLYASGDPVNRVDPSGRNEGFEYATLLNVARIIMFAITVYNAREVMKGHDGNGLTCALMLDGSALFFEMALIPAVVILIAFMDLACELFLHLPDVPPCGYGSSPNCG